MLTLSIGGCNPRCLLHLENNEVSPTVSWVTVLLLLNLGLRNKRDQTPFHDMP